MADDIWKKYETEEGSTPPIIKEGVDRFSRPLTKDDDPWSKYEREAEPSSNMGKTRKNIRPLINPPNWIKSYLGEPGDSPSPNTVLRQIGKGVPIAGQFIPKNEEMADMDKNYPVSSALAKGSGAVGSMVGPTALVSRGMANAGAPGVIPEIMAQFGLGAGVAGADKIAEKGFKVPNEELLNSILWGGASQGVGPLVGKMVSPLKNPHRLDMEDLAKIPETQLEKMFRPEIVKEEVKQAITNVFQHPVTTGLGGAALSYGTGAMHPFIGAALGAMAPGAIKSYAANTFAHNPTTQAILNSLTGHVGRQMEPQ